jgi:hypothetical protein
MLKTIVTAGLVLAFGATAAHAGPPVTRDQAFKLMARPGSWIEADGTLRPDGTLEAKDLEIVAPGDTAEMEETAIYGAVANLNRAKSTMRVLGYTITWDATTTLKDENKRQVLSSKLEDGMGVKVQGWVQANGSFKATKIKFQGKQLGKDGKPKDVKQKVFGPVTIVDARAGLLRVINTSVVLRENAAFVEVIPAAKSGN